MAVWTNPRSGGVQGPCSGRTTWSRMFSAVFAPVRGWAGPAAPHASSRTSRR